MEPWPFIIAFVIFKGTALAAVTFLIGTSFGQSLVIALVSSTIGAVGMIGSGFLAVRASERNRSEIRKTRRDVKAVKRTLGANQREEDEYDDEED